MLCAGLHLSVCLVAAAEVARGEIFDETARAGREFLQILLVTRARAPTFCRRVTRSRVHFQINFFAYQ